MTALADQARAIIRAELGRRNLRQADLARLMNLSPQTVSDKLTDGRDILCSSIDAMAKALGLRLYTACKAD